MSGKNLTLWLAAAFFWLAAVPRDDGPREDGARAHDSPAPALNAMDIVLGAPAVRPTLGVFFIRVPKTGSTTVREIVPPICEALGVQAEDILMDCDGQSASAP